MIQRATKHTPISASIEFINEQGTRDPTCRISQRLAVSCSWSSCQWVGVYFVTCSSLLFPQFLALSFNHPPAVSLSYYLQWRTSIVKLKPEFDEFSYLKQIVFSLILIYGSLRWVFFSVENSLQSYLSTSFGFLLSTTFNAWRNRKQKKTSW